LTLKGKTLKEYLEVKNHADRFVAIHPFDGGNGRVAIILMNFILLKAGFLPTVIKSENREEYDRALMKADKGDSSQFVNMVAGEEKNSLELMLSSISPKVQVAESPNVKPDAE
jgi:Fic family protein